MPGNGILQLWVPVVILAHLYALFWLVKMYLLTNSAGTDKLRKAMGQGVARTDKEDRLTTAVASGAGASPTPSTSSSTHSSLPEISISLPVIRRLTTLTSQMRLEWRNLSCSYNTPRGPKEVLHGVYGTAAPGEMQAFIGPSGAGKSTLMDILAKRKSTGAMGGQILVNGKPPSNKFLKRTAYVPQDDNFIPTMTTEETLSFYADLVLPSSMSGAERRQRVLEVLEVLGLSGHRRTLVGGQLPGGYLLRGLSGGERKRLSVAAGILATPSVIFLDEPTSGLDSFAAMTVMMYMKRMASATGQIVIACIHQPRSAIWNMFDTVLVLAEGMMMYQGPREGMVPWFSEELHYAYDPLLHGVPCDWAMDLVCTAFQKPERYYGSTIRSRAELKEAASRFRDAYHRRECLVEGGEVFWQSPPTQEPEDAVQEPADHPMGGVVAAGSVQGPGNVQESGADVSVAPDIEDLGRPAPSVRLMRTGSARAVSWAVDMSEHEHKEEGPAGCGGVIGSIRRSTTASRTVMPTAEPAVPPSLAALPSLELLEVARAPALAALKPRRNATPAAPRLEQSGIRDLDAILAHAQQPRWSLLAALGERLTSTWLFFRTLLWRELLMITRNPADVAGRMLTHAWVAIFVGLIFYNLSPGPESVRTRMNLVAIVPAFFLLMPYVSMSLFTADRSVFMADMSARLYSPGPYYVAKVVATTPFNIASALTFALITYGMAGLRHTPEAAFQNAVISCLLSLAALQVLHLAALIAPNQDGAFMLSIAWTALNLLMNPFFITSAEMVLTGLGQLRHISALAYGWEALLSTELGGRTFDCSKGFPSDLATLLPLLLPKTPLVSSPYVKQLLRSPGAGCIMDTDPVLAAFGLHNSYRMAVGVLLIYLAALHLLTFIALSLLARKKERR